MLTHNRPRTTATYLTTPALSSLHNQQHTSTNTQPQTTTLSPNKQVIKLISRVIADFANGEISQAGSLFDTEVTLEQYLDKSFYKTASLVAASCRSSAVFSNMDEQQKEAMYAYGKHLGLAFQVGVTVGGKE